MVRSFQLPPRNTRSEPSRRPRWVFHRGSLDRDHDQSRAPFEYIAVDISKSPQAIRPLQALRDAWVAPPELPIEPSVLAQTDPHRSRNRIPSWFRHGTRTPTALPWATDTCLLSFLTQLAAERGRVLPQNGLSTGQLDIRCEVQMDSSPLAACTAPASLRACSGRTALVISTRCWGRSLSLPFESESGEPIMNSPGLGCGPSSCRPSSRTTGTSFLGLLTGRNGWQRDTFHCTKAYRAAPCVPPSGEFR